MKKGHNNPRRNVFANSDQAVSMEPPKPRKRTVLDRRKQVEDREFVKVRCWCERREMDVTQELFKKKGTISCGRKDCHE